SIVFVSLYVLSVLLFFFQAEDGIRDATVTGVQTCALPIFVAKKASFFADFERLDSDQNAIINATVLDSALNPTPFNLAVLTPQRSEERRVGKECRCRWERDA